MNKVLSLYFSTNLLNINRRHISHNLIHGLLLPSVKLTGTKSHPQDGIGTEGPGMLGQLFQRLIPRLGNHFEIHGRFPAILGRFFEPSLPQTALQGEDLLEPW